MKSIPRNDLQERLQPKQNKTNKKSHLFILRQKAHAQMSVVIFFTKINQSLISFSMKFLKYLPLALWKLLAGKNSWRQRFLVEIFL